MPGRISRSDAGEGPGDGNVWLGRGDPNADVSSACRVPMGHARIDNHARGGCIVHSFVSDILTHVRREEELASLRWEGNRHPPFTRVNLKSPSFIISK